MAEAKFDIRTEATRPFYATVGATDLAVEVARNYVNDLQGRVADVQKKVAAFEFEPKTLNDKAQARVESRLQELQKELKEAQGRLEARLNELQADARALPAKVQAEVKDLVSDVTKAYEDFTKRGEGVVAKLRKLEVKLDVDSKSTKTTVTAEASTSTGTIKTPERKAARNAPAKKAPAKKTTAKKAPAKKATAKKA